MLQFLKRIYKSLLGCSSHGRPLRKERTVNRAYGRRGVRVGGGEPGVRGCVGQRKSFCFGQRIPAMFEWASMP